MMFSKSPTTLTDDLKLAELQMLRAREKLAAAETVFFEWTLKTERARNSLQRALNDLNPNLGEPQ